MDPATLAPGDPHYMAYVGPPGQYDVMAAVQFSLLFTLGLRAGHRVLDFGCGSLRAGRLLLPYLDPERYFGIEPNRWLIEEAIEKQVGEDLVRIKKPGFDHNDRFDTECFGVEFDFILAQSVFSHAGPEPVQRALESFGRTLRPDGVIAATFMEGGKDDVPGDWVYPGLVTYKRGTIVRFAREAGLVITRIPWYHPGFLTWYLIAKDAGRLPTKAMMPLLRGGPLEETSARVRARRAKRTTPASAELETLRPTVVGGSGGSGTRAVARVLQVGGVYLGSKLNHAEDHIPFGGLYGRWIRQWLANPHACEGPMREELAAVLGEHLRGIDPSRPWGWKIPPTAIVLPFLDRAMPQLRFLHLVRDGRDIAFSSNQRQLRKYGDALLGETGAVEPHRAIRLWAEVNERAATLGEERLADRYLRIRFEDLCKAPAEVVPQILAFAGVDGDPRRSVAEIQPPDSLGRWRTRDRETIAELEQAAEGTLRRFGYLGGEHD